MEKERKKYKVLEDGKLLLETNDYARAKQFQRAAHRTDPQKFHEMYEWSDELGRYVGTNQYAPGDPWDKW